MGKTKLERGRPGCNHGGLLKAAALRSDPRSMAIPDLCCPVCSADLPLNGDEKRGDEIFCTFCGSPFRLQIRPKSKDEGDDYSAEEDY